MALSFGSFGLKALIFVCCSIFVSAETTIYPATDIHVNESSTVTITCSFESTIGSRKLSVNGDESETVDVAVVNTTVSFSKLKGFVYTVRTVSPRIRIEIRFIASRAIDDAELQCVFSFVGQTDERSVAITVHVYYPPSPPTVNHEDLPVTFTGTPFTFHLNCSDLLSGNPLPDFTWKYDNSLIADVTPTGFQNSVLTVEIGSLEQIPKLVSGNFVCIASNRLGSASKSFSLNVTAVPSAPQQLQCDSESPSQLSKCIIRCMWNEPFYQGSPVISKYNLTVSQRGDQIIYNKVLKAGQTDYSIMDTSFASHVSNGNVTASVIAINDVGPGPGSSDMFIAPGPCMMPGRLRLAKKSATQNSISVTWNIPYCPASLSLLGFLVTATNDVTATNNVTAADVFNVDLDVGIADVTVEPLDPNTAYIVRVVGTNCFGETEPAELKVTTLKEGIPSEPVFQIESNVPGEILVTWEVPNAGRVDATITSYAIHYACGFNDEMTTGDISPLIQEFVLKGLGFGVNCSVDVVATNSLNNSSPRTLPPETIDTLMEVVTLTDDPDPVPIAVGVTAGVLVLLFLVAGGLYWRHRQKIRCGKDDMPKSSEETGSKPKTKPSESKQKNTNTQTTPISEYALLGAPPSNSPSTDSPKTDIGGLQYAELDHVSSIKKGSSEAPKKAEQTTYADIKHT